MPTQSLFPIRYVFLLTNISFLHGAAFFLRYAITVAGFSAQIKINSNMCTFTWCAGALFDLIYGNIVIPNVESTCETKSIESLNWVNGNSGGQWPTANHVRLNYFGIKNVFICTQKARIFYVKLFRSRVLNIKRTHFMVHINRVRAIKHSYWVSAFA